MKIVYRPHLEIRLKERKFPEDYPKKIVQEPEHRYVDKLTKHIIAIKQLHYAEKLRYIAVAYDIIDSVIEVITIHPVDEAEMRNKVRTGRWKLYAKN